MSQRANLNLALNREIEHPVLAEVIQYAFNNGTRDDGTEAVQDPFAHDLWLRRTLEYGELKVKVEIWSGIIADDFGHSLEISYKGDLCIKAEITRRGNKQKIKSFRNKSGLVEALGTLAS